jgi:branched-chain amino acid transport system substrate-binding protein
MRCLGKKSFIAALVGLLFVLMGAGAAPAAEPIVLGAPLATAFLYGWDAQRAITLAVEEINAAGALRLGRPAGHHPGRGGDQRRRRGEGGG